MYGCGWESIGDVWNSESLPPTSPKRGSPASRGPSPRRKGSVKLVGDPEVARLQVPSDIPGDLIMGKSLNTCHEKSLLETGCWLEAKHIPGLQGTSS